MLTFLGRVGGSNQAHVAATTPTQRPDKLPILAAEPAAARGCALDLLAFLIAY